jgi:hypothetical protein
MTIKAFIGFPKKPNKSPGAAIARAFGMNEKSNTVEFEWLFQKTKFRVMLEDLREQMKPDLREWADEVGWGYNWAIQIAVHEKRDSIDYLKWVSLVTMLMEAYNQTNVWFDEGTDTPQLRMKLDSFAPLKHEFKEGEAAQVEGSNNRIEVQEEEDMFADEEPKGEELMNGFLNTTPDTDTQGLPPGLMALIRSELGVKAEVAEEPPAPALVPVPEDDDDFDDFEDWDEDEDDDDEDAEPQPVTWD